MLIGYLKPKRILMKSTLRNFLNSALIVACILFTSNTVSAQLETTTSDDAEALVTNLIGEGIIIGDITMNCPTGAAGFFDCVDCNVGIGSGILLTTGQPSNAVGPNNSGSTGTDNFAPGDPDLDLIEGVVGTNDACVLEFDMTATSDTIRFNYVFASEEYIEYVNSINDVFAFYISGPGIVGAENVALIPGTATEVAINNVNHLVNTEYFIQNGTGFEPPYSVDDYYIQYDGFTTVLEAKKNVIPCETYHLKIAIADDADGVWDSGVFIEAGSLSSPGVTLTYESDIEGYDNIIEGCNDGHLSFDLSFPPVDTFAVAVTVGGTATNGTDFTLVPDSIYFVPGDTSYTIDFSTFSDGLDEGMETIIITVDIGCTIGLDDTIVLYVYDALPLEISNDTLICPGDPAFLTASGAETYSWEPTETLSTPDEASTDANPTEPTTYTVTGTLASCVNTAEVFVDIQSPTANAGEDTTIYFGESAFLDGSGGVEYSWSPTTGLSDPNSENPIATPLVTTTYTVTVTTAIGCKFTDEVTVFVSSDALVDVPNAFSPNGDNSNDIFGAIIRGQVSVFHLQIYNRWGKLVFESADFTKGWDGKLENEEQPIGSFVYVLNYTDMNGQDFFDKGNFILVR